MNRKLNARSGVTLIEMLVVVVIISVFAGVAFVKLWPEADKGKIGAAKQQVAILQEALETYQIRNGSFPTQEQGLSALKPILNKELGNDPWGNPYVYKYPGDHGDEPDIMSYGADGRPGGTGSDADIVSWK